MALILGTVYVKSLNCEDQFFGTFDSGNFLFEENSFEDPNISIVKSSIFEDFLFLRTSLFATQILEGLDF